VSALVLYEKRGHVAHIRLNRPEVHNALAPESVRALAAIWQDFSLDRTVRVGILSGEGPSFCSGMDLKRTNPGFGPVREAGDAQEPIDAQEALPRERRRINYVPPADLTKPLVCAIHGVAAGGGLELALGCDIRIAAEGSRMGLPEVTRGLAPGSGGMYWLARVVGLGPAMEMLLTGDLIDDREALALRLVNRVVPQARLMPTAEALAEKIAANAPLAVEAIKETVRRGLAAGPSEGLAISENQVRVLRLTDDYEEGRRAFREKRRPVFRGR
jgi:enoyl-CoA hydratase/carnithine racemase